jgi:hypothetical protein
MEPSQGESSNAEFDERRRNVQREESDDLVPTQMQEAIPEAVLKPASAARSALGVHGESCHPKCVQVAENRTPRHIEFLGQPIGRQAPARLQMSQEEKQTICAHSTPPRRRVSVTQDVTGTDYATPGDREREVPTA